MIRQLIISLIMLVGANFASFGQINTDQVLQVGRNALYFEDYMLSIQYFNQVIQAKPYLAQPYLYRAIAKLNLDDYKGASEDATLAIERNPFIADAYEVRGVAYQNLEKPQLAIADYDAALAQLPDNRSILFNKAIALEDVKDYEGAAESYEKLLKAHPKFDNAYLGRARLYLQTGDTVAALADLDKVISLNPNSVNAYVIRADIAIKREEDFNRALSDMNEAIKLQPHYAGFFVNRAFLRYKLDDYFGAMADYDYAISLDPMSQIAYFNRGLLRAEVSDRDRAIADFTKVLSFDPDDYRALFNRAILYEQNRDYRKAIADIDKVVEAFPDFDGAYFTRFRIYDEMGDKRNAEKDYNKALALSKAAKANKDVQKDKGEKGDTTTPEAETDDSSPDKLISQRFSTLLTIENSHDVDREFNNKSIRGRVQDRDVAVQMRPMFRLAYYVTTNQLKETPYYIKEVDDINATRSLRFILQVTEDDSPLEDEASVARHFQSIEYYNSYIPTHQPRAIDYFGRAMDFMTIRNYEGAIQDFTKAIELKSDFEMAYLMRAIARYQQMIFERNESSTKALSNTKQDFGSANTRVRNTIKEIINDFNKVIELSPRNPFAYFNKGVILAEAGDNTSALSLFSKAVELKPDFGEAYYNRGYIYMQLGQRQKGADDLSKAGELGVLPSYNLLKRMNR